MHGNKRRWRPTWRLLTAALLLTAAKVGQAAPPNIVVIFCDDLGYGDLSCYGHPTLHTPHLDRMAAEGVRFTQFYSAAEVCTPSRAALLTGRLPIRNGMCSSRRRVLFPNSKGGLPAEEITLAEVLKEQGYATACIGKWHLGHLPEYLPTRHGFDYYFGVPYSNDMDRVADAPQGRKAFDDPRSAYWNVPLLRNEEIIERPAEQTTLTRRYTDETLKFIRDHSAQPFFIYLAHTMPHVPLFRSAEFEEHSRRGLYGDVVEEIDDGVGKILQQLRDSGLDQNTLVFFTSDNGPWLIFNEQGGSAGPLRDGKGSTWEGGMREPALAWWPGRIPGGRVVHDLGCTMDIFVTVHALLKVPVPDDRVLDGFDLSAVLFNEGPSPRDHMIYYRGDRLMAARQGPWKMHLWTQAAYGEPQPTQHDPPLLYHLGHDPGEQHELENPEIIRALQQLVAEHQRGWAPPTSQLER